MVHATFHELEGRDMGIMNKLGSAADKAAELKEQATNAAQDKLMGAVEATLGDLSRLKTILASAGIVIGDIELTLGLPPSVQADVRVPDPTSLEGARAALSAVELTGTQKLIVDSILSLADLQIKLEQRLHGLLGAVQIKAGLPPKMVVRLA